VTIIGKATNLVFNNENQ